MIPPSIATVIVPAHNEAAGLRALLHLLDPLRHGLRVIVVTNGCTDESASVARTFESSALRVVDLKEPSKRAALRAGDSGSDPLLPRVYVDADVEISGDDVVRLVEVMTERRLLAASPHRLLDTSGANFLVRAHTDVWSRLPNVEAGLFGRGVIAVSPRGYERLAGLPDRLSDDLRLSEAFSTDERAVIPEVVVRIRTPRTTAALIGRRVRVVTGNAEMDAAAERSSAARTTWRDLAVIAGSSPRSTVNVIVFVAVSAVSRILARPAIRSGDFRTWRRDESSRVQVGSGDQSPSGPAHRE